MSNKSYKFGNVTVTQWKNGEHYSYTLQKSYKDKEGAWQTTKSFSRDELLKLKEAISFIMSEDVKVFKNETN